MYSDILFPTDGSDDSLVALDHALEIADRFDATLHVLYVADTNRDSVTTVGGEVVDALVSEGDEVVETVADRARSRGLTVVDEVIQGDPHRTILDYASDRDIDLIVMATHGRRGLDRYLIGSVTERVVRTATVPVVTVRIDE